MRIFALVLALTLSGCWRSAIIDGRKVDDPPKCLMTFNSSLGCWADGRWYSECPWDSPGRFKGYYGFENGFWRLHGDHVLREPEDGPPPEEWCLDGPSPSSDPLQSPTRVR